MNTASVMSASVLSDIAKTVLSYSTVDTMRVFLVHTAYGITRVARNRVRSGEDGDSLVLKIYTQDGTKVVFEYETNQITESVLKAAVQYAETQARRGQRDGSDKEVHLGPRNFLPVTLSHRATHEALADGRHVVGSALIRALVNAKLKGSAFVGVMARSTCIMDKSGFVATAEETDAEVSLIAWSPDGKGSGWSGQADRDWSKINIDKLATEAISIAHRSSNPVAFEPGRRIAILGPAAVAQLMRYVPSGLGSGPGPIGNLVCDRRLTLSSDPRDPEGGYVPFFPTDSPWTRVGYPIRPMVWIRNGVQENYALSPDLAAQAGRVPHPTPSSFRLSGGPTSIDDMISSCKLGVYINRLFGGATGFTRDGCFLVKNGKIERPIKNFRIKENPWISLNSIEAIGPTSRAAWGYPGSANKPWPLEPVIVPPLMVRDFNLIALADAV